MESVVLENPQKLYNEHSYYRKTPKTIIAESIILENPQKLSQQPSVF